MHNDLVCVPHLWVISDLKPMTRRHSGSKCRQVRNRRLALFLLGACFITSTLMVLIHDETYCFDRRPIDRMTDVALFYLIPNITSFGYSEHIETDVSISHVINPMHIDTDTDYNLTSPNAKSRPNILFILADDLGFNDVGYIAEDNGIRTPNLDQLAMNGIKLTNYYTLCVCSASRGVILTGRYDINNGMRGIATQKGRKGVNLNVPLISDLLSFGGYSTYCIGKWHIGKSSWYQTPTHRGFDYFYGMLGGAANYFTHISGPHTYDWSEHRGQGCADTDCARVAEEDYGTHSTYLLTDKTIEIITNHSSSESDPFFLYLSYQAIHSPPLVPLHYIDLFNDTFKNLKRRLAAGMIYQLDEGIGNITATLSKFGMMENTVIIFTSDNGAAIGTGDGIGGENWPLRGGKHSIWEGGTKVPALIHYPPFHRKQSMDYSFLFHSADWAPTFAQIARIGSKSLMESEDPKMNGSLFEMNGISHWNNLGSHPGQRGEVREWIYYGNDNPNHGASPGRKFGLRFGKYKALFGGGGEPRFWMRFDDDATQKEGSTAYNWENEASEMTKQKRRLRRKVRKQKVSRMFLFDLEEDPLEKNNIWEMTEAMKEIGSKMKEKRDEFSGDSKSKKRGRNMGAKCAFIGRRKPILQHVKEPKLKGPTWPC